MKEGKTIGFALLLFLIFEAFYSGWDFSVNALNKIFALESVALISVALLIGSLSRFFPRLNQFKPRRRALGIIGFALASIHLLLSLWLWFAFDFTKLISSPRLTAILTGFLAFFIFLAMALTSTESAIRKLGYPLWKKIQMLGYLALAFVVTHFFLAETKNGVFLVKPLAFAVLVLAIFAVAARFAAFLAGFPGKKKIEEHVDATEQRMP